MFCEMFARLGFAILETVADEVTEAGGTAAPNRQVSIIVDDGRFRPDPPADVTPDATDGAEVLILAGIVLDPVTIGGKTLAASTATAEQPLSAIAPDFL